MSVPNTQQLDLAPGGVCRPPGSSTCFLHVFQGRLQPSARTWGLVSSAGITQEWAFIPRHTWTGYFSKMLVFLFPVCHFPPSFMSISLISPLSLNAFCSLLASGQKAATQTLKDQVKIPKRERTKYSHFRWRSRWGCWHVRGFQWTLCSGLEGDRLRLPTRKHHGGRLPGQRTAVSQSPFLPAGHRGNHWVYADSLGT